MAKGIEIEKEKEKERDTHRGRETPIHTEGETERERDGLNFALELQSHLHRLCLVDTPLSPTRPPF